MFIDFFTAQQLLDDYDIHVLRSFSLGPLPLVSPQRNHGGEDAFQRLERPRNLLEHLLHICIGRRAKLDDVCVMEKREQVIQTSQLCWNIGESEMSSCLSLQRASELLF